MMYDLGTYLFFIDYDKQAVLMQVMGHCQGKYVMKINNYSYKTWSVDDINSNKNFQIFDKDPMQYFPELFI